MELTLNTEPHISAGVVNPTVGKCNITLPGEHSPSLIEWRQRREQAKGNYTAFERRLRLHGKTFVFETYNAEGHLINATFPTGEVSSLQSNTEKSVRVEVDTSNKENFVTATNLSATNTIYTLRQGMHCTHAHMRQVTSPLPPIRWDAKLKAPSSMAVSPDGTLYIADLGNVRIRALSRNKPQLNRMHMYEIASAVDQELYLFSTNGTHLHTLNLITGDYIYNFTYSGEQDLNTIISSNGNSVHIRRDANGVPLWLVVPGGQVYWLTISNNGALNRVSAQGHDLAQITYHGNSGLLATKSNENGWTTVYE
ncbi:Teneurin-1 [Acipenser ruthenus]|uniref:Teneurin-1 n=1 Tax=Acipenser ruthenus TaxID=7906 RepID=A0A444V0N2_ACIRT|nr:Teneurin-1 [Acipenser ruthenus]